MTKKNAKTSQRGAIATLLVFLILVVIMLIAFGLSAIFLREVKTSAYVARSAAAYYAAESGIEYALFQIKERNPSDGGLYSREELGLPIMENGADFKLTLASNYSSAVSTGTYLNNNRRIEIGY